MPRGPSPYKGIPRSEWGKVRAQSQEQRLSEIREQTRAEIGAKSASNAFVDPIPAFVPREPVAPRETIQEKPKEVNQLQRSMDDPIDLFSGTQLALKVYSKDGDDKDPVPGFFTYWFEDDESLQRITMAKRSGWQHVDRDEVLMHNGLTPGNEDLGSAVSKGIPGSSPPRRMYLMKLPNELRAKFMQQREEKIHKPIWDMLRRGTAGQKIEGQYTPKMQTKITVETK